MKLMFKAAAIAAFFLSSTSAFAQAQAIIIVDMDRVASASAAGKSGQQQLQSKLTSVQGRAKALGDQFRAEEDTLRKAQQTNTMAPAAFQEKVKALQTKQVNAQNELRGREQEFQRSQQFVRSQIFNAVSPIIAQVMREKNAQVVVAREATLNYNPALDVTTDVIRRLDAALPRVNVNPPPAPAAAKK